MLLPPAGTSEKEGNRLWQHCCVVPPLTVKRVTRYSKTITSSHNRTALTLSLQDYLIPQSTARSPGQGNTPYRWAGTGALRPMGEPLDDIIAIHSALVAADKVSRPPSLHAVTAPSIYTAVAEEAGQTPRRCLTGKFRLVWRFSLSRTQSQVLDKFDETKDTRKQICANCHN